MPDSKFKIKLHLGLGFGLIIILMCILCGISILSTKRLTNLTSESFLHPLTVSNALREIKGDIFNIQRLTRGAILIDTTRDKSDRISAIDSCALMIERNLALVDQRYLGEKGDIETIRTLVAQWEPIRDSLLVLIFSGQETQVYEPVLIRSAQHVDSLLHALQVPINFAGNKSMEFYSHSQAAGRSAARNIILLFSFLIILSTGVGLYVTHRALKDFDEINRYNLELGKSRRLESVGRLAGGIAHDFNNMLMPIIAYSNMMLGEKERSADDRERLEQINLAGRRASELIKQLLAFSRKQILEMKSLNLNDVVLEMEKMMRRLIGENIVLHVFLAPGLGHVSADRAQLDQILLNIVVNARDAMPDGGKLTIETQNVYLDENYASSREDVVAGDYVMLAVSDTGTGMEPEIRDRIFEPFFTTKQIGKGTGLGMATIYGIAKQHGGNINVYSEPGQGTTFKVYLPLVEKTVQSDTVEQPELPPKGNGDLVMVVEDERQVLDLVCEILSENNYKLIKPQSAEQALEMAGRKDLKIDLLLTDVIMPVMSGRNLYEKMMVLRPGLKVVYMSGYTDNVIAHHGILDAGIHFLQKPFTESALLKKVREALDH